MWKSEMSEPEFSRTNEIPFGWPKIEEIEVETDGENPQHAGVMNAFASAILHGTELVADGREGINGLSISNAMHLSSWLGKEISMDELDSELFYNELMKRVSASNTKKEVKETVADDMGASFR
jgi:hypothetical protein